MIGKGADYQGKRNSYGSWTTIFSITGILRLFGARPHAYFTHKAHVCSKSLMPPVIEIEATL
jgi:hypothetical protein